MKKFDTIAIFVALVLPVRQTYAQNPFYDFSTHLLSTLANIKDPLSILNPPTFVEMASLYDHPAEKHEVTTEDGYILTLFRLPGNRSSLPVLLFHGILDSSDTWIIRGQTSLAITLANKNYDVWLGNVRGNRYSQGHIYLNPKVDPAYWNFSFDEHGLYDLPACIDYILNNTGAQKLNMFGHSQGNIMIWVLLSTRTEYNDKINVATALAPVYYAQHFLEPIPLLLRVFNRFYPVFRALGVTNVLGDNSFLSLLFKLIARIPVLGYIIDGYGILFAVFGLDSTELEPSFLPTVTLHVPTWTSSKNVNHLYQIMVGTQLTRYDYGATGNLAAYNSSTAPIYKLGNISTKVVLLAARNDKFSQLVDVEKLRRHLPNVIKYIINPRVIMNHIDYIWGRTAAKYLYNYIFDVLDNYS